MSITTLEFVRSALRVDGDADDILISSAMETGENAVRDWLGNPFVDSTLGQAVSQIAQAQRDIQSMTSAIVFYAREIYEGNAHELTPSLPTPHAFYRILKSMSVRANIYDESQHARLVGGMVSGIPTFSVLQGLRVVNP